MIHTLLIFNFICISFAQDTTVLNEKINGGSNVSSKFNTVTFNRTFFDKSDNLLRVPSAIHEEKRKLKTKKSPKRTIQKIIKKNNVKHKRIYVLPVTYTPTQTTNNKPSIYSRINDVQTTEANSRKRSRKNSKLLRYMPFHKLQKARRNKRRTENIGDHSKARSKRAADRDDIIILKDLDEIEFVGSDKDYSIVKAHIQNVW